MEQEQSQPPLLTEHTIKKVCELVDEAEQLFGESGDRKTSRSLLKAALAFLGEAVKPTDFTREELLEQSPLADEDDFQDMKSNIHGMSRKLKQALRQHEKAAVVTYLRSIRRMLGNEPGSGSSTPRPRDYDAVISRFGESFNSPSQERSLPEQKRFESTHTIDYPLH